MSRGADERGPDSYSLRAQCDEPLEGVVEHCHGTPSFDRRGIDLRPMASELRWAHHPAKTRSPPGRETPVGCETCGKLSPSPATGGVLVHIELAFGGAS